MKRLLLPLLAALALPTAVNAETFYLECEFEQTKRIIKILVQLSITNELIYPCLN